MKIDWNKCGFVFMWISAVLTAVMVLLILLFLYGDAKNFFESYSLTDFLLGSVWKPSDEKFGILPMILGTFLTTLLALILALPAGLMAVIYGKYYAPRRIRLVFETLVGIMASIPSIVYGLFALSWLTKVVKQMFGGTGFSLLTAGLLLAIMVLPTVMTLYSSELDSIPEEYYMCAVALGETKTRSVLKCILPLSSYGIFSAGISALGRAVGETMAVLLIVGNTAVFPDSLAGGVRTLTTNISLEMGYATGLHRQALIACGMVLLIMILVLELLIFQMKRKWIHEK